MKFVILFLVALFSCTSLSGRSPDGCTPYSWRCRNDRPQICSAQRYWHDNADTACGYRNDQHCAMVGTIATCVRN